MPKSLRPRQLTYHFWQVLLAKKLERALLRLEARLNQALQRLLARRVLLAANNAPLLRLHEVLAREPTARVLGRAVKDLCLRANRL